MVLHVLLGVWIEIAADAIDGRPLASFLRTMTSPDVIVAVKSLYLIEYAMAVVALLLCIAFVIALVRERRK